MQDLLDTALALIARIEGHLAASEAALRRSAEVLAAESLDEAAGGGLSVSAGLVPGPLHRGA